MSSVPFTVPEAALDERDLPALRAGDHDAFARLVDRHGPRLLAVVRRLLRDEHEAHDALQDAFTSAHRALPSFEGSSRLGTWLHRIAINAALMRLRARRRRPEVAIDAMLPTFDSTGHRVVLREAWSESADTRLERAETRALVRRLIDRLPEDHRTVLLLRDIEELETRETAELMGCTGGAVKVRLHRARQALRQLLEEELPR
ncbi:MAG: sigma-70 family RNA polymerase sigma factor [Phycisphaerae bacterium]|nr:sigma-70 family RNA polymerase sigma factor [Phycisphaerae bacterium]